METKPSEDAANVLFDQAMKITDQVEADAHFELLVQRLMTRDGMDRAEAEALTRHDLGYWAGYYSHETRARVEQLFRCAHPYFGPIAENGPPTMEQALSIGRALGEAVTNKSKVDA